jgi:hypothetical protein
MQWSNVLSAGKIMFNGTLLGKQILVQSNWLSLRRIGFIGMVQIALSNSCAGAAR